MDTENTLHPHIKIRWGLLMMSPRELSLLDDFVVRRFDLDNWCSELVGCLESDSGSNLSNSTGDHNIDSDNGSFNFLGKLTPSGCSLQHQHKQVLTSAQQMTPYMCSHTCVCSVCFQLPITNWTNSIDSFFH